MRILVGIFIFILTLTTAAGDASAKPTAHARQLYEKGEAAYQIGDFATAASLFEQAYADSKLPVLLWNIARALRRQYDLDHDIGHLRRARAVYENYANSADDEKSRADAQHEMAAVDALIADAESGKQVTAATTDETHDAGFAMMPDVDAGTAHAGAATTPPAKTTTPAATTPPAAPTTVASTTTPAATTTPAVPSPAEAAKAVPAAPVADAVQPPSKSDEAPPPPHKTRWWVWAVAGAAVVAVGAGVGLAVALSPHDPTAPAGAGTSYMPTF